MLIATAGHIDHGKTALVRALTGVETDRLPEEKARGITIDLGFAYWQPEPGLTISFVDVPGHERFVRTMLAGVAGAEFALIVVAADDGVMPQTIEHVHILHLMGITRGLVAITKSDNAPPERRGAIAEQISDLLAPTALAGLPLLEVSAKSGEGIAALGAMLIAAAQQDRPARADRHFRMAIDRAFTIPGAGTVATGTVLSGHLRIGDIRTLAPKNITARVRGLQSAGETTEIVYAGERCAVNITGVEIAQIHRGDWLLAPAMSQPTDRVEVQITLLKNGPNPLKHTMRVHVHHGTADIGAKVLLRRRASLAGGEQDLATLVLDKPICAVTGDHFVLRDSSGRVLLGGGRILDPYLPNDRRAVADRVPVAAALAQFDPATTLQALLAIPGRPIDTLWFARCFNLTDEAAQRLLRAADVVLFGKNSDLAMAAEQFAALQQSLLETIAAFHRDHPEIGGVTQRELQRRLPSKPADYLLSALLDNLKGQGRIASRGAIIHLPEHAVSFTAAEISLWRALQTLVEGRDRKPLSTADLVRELHVSEATLRAMLYRRRLNGEIWMIEDSRFMLRDHVASLAAVAAALTAENPGGFTAAQFRDASGIGRNHVIKVLEFFDRIGVTARREDSRVVRPDYANVVGAKNT